MKSFHLFHSYWSTLESMLLAAWGQRLVQIVSVLLAWCGPHPESTTGSNMESLLSGCAVLYAFG